MKKTILLASMLLSLASLSACNTIHGFGQDLTNAGGLIMNSADKSQKEMQPAPDNRVEFPNDQHPGDVNKK